VFLQLLVCGRSVMVGWQSASTAARHCHLEGRRRKASIFEKAVSRTGRSTRWTAGYKQGSISLIPHRACTGTRNGLLDQSPIPRRTRPPCRPPALTRPPTPHPRSSTYGANHNQMADRAPTNSSTRPPPEGLFTCPRPMARSARNRHPPRSVILQVRPVAAFRITPVGCLRKAADSPVTDVALPSGKVRPLGLRLVLGGQPRRQTARLSVFCDPGS
jgi:hypothetical protein